MAVHQRGLKIIRHTLDRLSLYLPVLLMASLALGTYWLVRTAPHFDAPRPELPPKHEVDYFLRDFSIKTFDPEGRIKSELRGQTARHYPDTDTLEIDNVQIYLHGVKGEVTKATAKSALSNADGTEVQLFGDALVIREAFKTENDDLPRLEFRSQFLHAYTDTERLSSHLPVVLIKNQDQFVGDSMFYDNVEQQLTLTGRVQGTLTAQTQKSK